MPLGRRRITYSSRPTHAARSAHAKGEKIFRTYDTSYIRPRRPKGPIIVTCVIIGIVLVVIGFFLFRFIAANQAPTLPEGQEAVVTIDQGESAQAIGDALTKAGLVGSADTFVNAVRSAGAESALIPGTYLFVGGTSPEDIIEILRTGPEATADKLVIPEGLTREATANAVASATRGRITAEAFLASSSDASRWAPNYPFLESAGTNSLEGFLFPKTYTLTPADGPDQVVAMMLDQFGAETANLSYAYPEQRGLTLYETVILASIVEKESSADTMTTVASVFYNRLASDHPYLDSDATTAYEVGHDPTGEEVHANSTYSTYTNPGLPPTPICSPSLAALSAVCDPADTDYMYFYFYPDDSGAIQYQFSETYEQHQNAIANASNARGTDAL